GLGTLYEDDPECDVTAAGPGDIPDMLMLLQTFPPPAVGLPAVEREPRRLGPLLTDPDTCGMVARDRAGILRGYGFYVRITERNRRLLADDDELAAVLDRVAVHIDAADRKYPDDSNVYYLSTVVLDDENSVAGSVLARAVLGLLLNEGVYVAIPGRPPYVQILDALQFDHLTQTSEQSRSALPARILDLSRCGFEGWLRNVMAGQAPELLPLGDRLTALVSGAVANFDRDDNLVSSPLGLLAEPDDEVAESERAQGVRDLLRRAVTAGGRWPTPEVRIRDALRTAGVQALSPRAPTEPADLVTGVATSADGRREATSAAGHAGHAGQPRLADGRPGVHVTLLGGFQVTRDGQDVPIPHGVVATAIKIVAVQGAVPADELIEVIWPEVDPGVGRDRLRTVMARVRRAAGPDVLVRRGNAITLGTAVSTDAGQFATAATSVLTNRSVTHRERARGARAAVAGYTGELLPADRYSDWTAAHRERLLRQYLDLLDIQADLAESTHDVDEAVRWLERAVEADPYEEERYLRAARLLAADGRRGRALAVLERAQAAAASLEVPVSERVSRLQRLLSGNP
ncbi:MAG: hypothetical protein JWO57_3668, partial [Pseudonocardiales bacterium]|nr:hypothetical protein [Pseudonocardiales bacterium]